MSGAKKAAGAVFLDRDGVINEVVFRDGKPASPRSLEEFVFTPGVEAAVARAKAAGYPVFVCTNQPDVARNKMSAEALEQMHARLREALDVDAVVACTHDNHHQCRCRKPKPGMLVDLAAEHGVDLSSSYFIGDSAKDMGAGEAAGVRTILLRRPYNEGTHGDIEVADLPAAIDRILGTGS